MHKVLVDSFGSAGGAAVTNLTTAFTNNGRSILCGVGSWDATAGQARVSSVTFLGVNFSLISGAQRQNAGNDNVEIWGLVDAPIGSGNLIVTTVGNCDELAAGWTSFYHSHPVAPFANGTSAEGTNSLPLVTVSSAHPLGIVFNVGYHASDSTDVPDFGQIAHANYPNSQRAYVSVREGISGGRMGWDMGVDTGWVVAGCQVLPAPMTVRGPAHQIMG